MGTNIVLIFNVYIVEDNGQVSYDFLTICLEDA
jgi:hypothetical protein